MSLDWVGFKGVARRAYIESPEGRIILDLDMDILVSIDSTRRGAHLSRNIEAIRDSIEPPHSAPSLEKYLELIAKSLLRRHSYAGAARVTARTRYYVDVRHEAFHGEEPVDVEISVYMDRRGERRWRVSVTVKGMTVCPSAQTTIASILGKSTGEAPSHSQKAILKGTIETRRVMVRIEDIARALFKSFSAPSATLLKRGQEARLILEAHRNPVFVEDLVRRGVAGLLDVARSVDAREAVIEVEAVSLESIHPHDVYAFKRIELKPGAEG